MIDLIITHLTHPWGLPGTLETLGDPEKSYTPFFSILDLDRLFSRVHFLSFSGHIRPFFVDVLEVWLGVAQICPPGLVDIAMDLQLF